MATESQSKFTPPSTQDVPSRDAEQIKAEGNALFIQGSFLPAMEKYNLAIERAPHNAILHANRAACHIALKDYQKAADDAIKATELDPNYPKGWGRLGAAQEALSNTVSAQNSYSRAISCLEAVKPLSAANKRLIQQYENCVSLLREKHSRHIVLPGGSGSSRLPWQLAKALPPQPPNSSAWVIIEANKDFEEALIMIKTYQSSQGVAIGMTGGLTILSNAILQDDRCFHITDQNFFTLYNKYMAFEIIKSGAQAWYETRDPKELIRLVKERVVLFGWDQTRPVLALTIRVWILKAFLTHGFGGTNEETNELYERVTTTLELGRHEWSDVETELRGVIFEDTFLRGVHVLQVHAYMEALNDPTKTSFTLARLLEIAETILSELDRSVPPDPRASPGFHSAFYIYPRGSAFSIKGFYHMQMAKRSKTEEDWRNHMRDCVKFYLDAAEQYPEDDENHACFLRHALNYGFQIGTSARDSLVLMKRIRDALPKMRRIWENSSLSTAGVHSRLYKILEVEDQLRDAIAQGKFALDDKVMLQVE